MGWELSLVVTVYKRGDWLDGLQQPVKPVAEKRFKSPVSLVYTQVDLAIALRLTAEQANKWLNRQRVDLVEEVVVTLYSLEAASDASHSSN